MGHKAKPPALGEARPQLLLTLGLRLSSGLKPLSYPAQLQGLALGMEHGAPGSCLWNSWMEG